MANISKAAHWCWTVSLVSLNKLMIDVEPVFLVCSILHHAKSCFTLIREQVINCIACFFLACVTLYIHWTQFCLFTPLIYFYLRAFFVLIYLAHKLGVRSLLSVSKVYFGHPQQLNVIWINITWLKYTDGKRNTIIPYFSYIYLRPHIINKLTLLLHSFHNSN